MKHSQFLFFVCILLTLCACGSTETPDGTGTPNGANTENDSAAISAVSITGMPGNYTFSVTITSPDTGCEQYADWWEVFTADGTLIYRRILAHSHVNEQPFTRSGGPVNILADEAFTVRAHMNNLGYGTRVFAGSINQGLSARSVEKEVSFELSMTEPLPNGCAF